MDWIGNLFIIVGLWLIGSKQRKAFLFSIIGEVFWIIHSLRHGMFSLAFICSIFGAMAIRSWLKWGRA